MPFFFDPNGSSDISTSSYLRVAADRNSRYKAPDWKASEWLVPGYDIPDAKKVRAEIWGNSRLKLTRRRASIPHLLPDVFGTAILSDVVKSVIDELEPEFQPRYRTTVIDHKWNELPFPFWYYEFRDAPQIEAIDVERTQAGVVDRPAHKGDLFVPTVLHLGFDDVFLREDAISGRHFFAEKRYRLSNWVFASEEFVKRLRERGATTCMRLSEVFVS